MTKIRFNQSANDAEPVHLKKGENSTLDGRRRLTDVVIAPKRKLNLERRIPSNERRVKKMTHPETPARRLIIDRRNSPKDRRASS